MRKKERTVEKKEDVSLFFKLKLLAQMFCMNSVEMKTYKSRDWNKMKKKITYPSGIVKMMMCRLHTWLSVQRLWKDFACRENIVAFLNGLTFVIDACRFNQLDSGEVTLQNLLPLIIVWCSGGKKSSFRSHTQNTVLISGCFDFVFCIQCVQGLGRRYEIGRSSCIALYFLPISLSGYQCFQTGKSYFWNLTDL